MDSANEHNARSFMERFGSVYLEGVSKYWALNVISRLHSRKLKKQAVESINDILSGGYNPELAGRILATLEKDHHYKICPGCEWKLRSALAELCMLGAGSVHDDYRIHLEAAGNAAGREYSDSLFCGDHWRVSWAKSRVAVVYLLAGDEIGQAQMFKEAFSHFIKWEASPFSRKNSMAAGFSILPAAMAVGLIMLMRDGTCETGDDLLDYARSYLSDDAREAHPLLEAFSINACREMSFNDTGEFVISLLRIYKNQGEREIESLIRARLPQLKPSYFMDMAGEKYGIHRRLREGD